MAGRLSVFVAVVLVMCAEFPRSNGFQWLEPTTSSSEPAPQVNKSVVYYPMASSVSVTMKWKWRFSGNEAFAVVVIKRYKVNDELNTEVHVASYLITVGGLFSENINSNYYSQQVNTGKDAGNITFTIKDVTKQTNNRDGGAVNVLALDGDYVFTCELNIVITQRTSAIKLIVNEKPKITTPPQSQYITKANKEVKLKCIATGKPKPVITWEIKKFSGQISSKYGPEIMFKSFTRDDVGVYKCKVKNVYGEDTAEALLQYTLCGSGCSSKDLAIEMKQLNYQDGYDQIYSENSKKLKKQIETECLQLYTKQSDPKIYSCVVKGFRKGSVVAKMKLTFPSGTSDPDKPLRDAIKTGRFSGYDVTTSFVTFVSPKIIYPQSQACNPLTVNENQDATLVCNATGKPTPTITWTKDGIPSKGSKQGSPLVLQNVVRNQTGNYTCTADNGVGRADTACWKLDVKYFHNNKRCGKTYEISSAQCLSVRLDGNPFPSVRCSPKDNVHVTRDGNTYNVCGKKAKTKTNCTVYSAVGSCDITLEVHQHIMNKVWLGWYRITNLEWNDLLENTNSKEFSSLKTQNENMLKSVYAHQLFVTSTLVVNFRKGSVIVNYLLIITANISDPSILFKEALNSTGGTLNGLSIDYSSIQAESYFTPTSSESPRTVLLECSQDCPSTVTTTVLGVLFGLSLVLIVILIVYIVWKNRKEQNGGPNKRQDITEESGYMNAIVLQDRTNQSSSNQNTVLDYEIVDNQSQPGQSPANPPLYQSIQPHSDTYSSLSPATKLPPKPTLPSTQSQANTHTSVYQDLQVVSHQYQSLDSLSPC